MANVTQTKGTTEKRTLKEKLDLSCKRIGFKGLLLVYKVLRDPCLC